MRLVDSHCHLNMLELDPYEGQLDKAVAHAQAVGIAYMLNVCVTLKDYPALLKTSEAYPFVWASVGLHPNERDEETTADALVKLAEHQKVVAIGETGLDYYRSTGDLEWQKERFREHIRAARQLRMPVIVHSRQAKEDTIAILREEQAAEVGGVLHCFTEDWEMASAALDLGFYVSFSGIVTFNNAHSIQEVAKRLPLDRMLLETDSPYLAPMPVRGKPNEPAYMVHTAQFIAKMRGLEAEVLGEATTANFFRLFHSAKA